jgi:hypothetical protein
MDERERTAMQLGTKCGKELLEAEPDQVFSRSELRKRWGALPDDDRHFFWGIRRALQEGTREYEPVGAGMIRIVPKGEDSAYSALDRSYTDIISAAKRGVGAMERMRPAADPELRVKLVNEQAQLAKVQQQTELMRSKTRRRLRLMNAAMFLLGFGIGALAHVAVS